jgi:hypothetical protein
MRDAAPPYRGEGPHALWHASEDESIHRFDPRDGEPRLFAFWDTVVRSTLGFRGTGSGTRG